MGSNLQNDQLYSAQTEIRHLKDTISELRQQLDRFSIDKEEGFRKAVVTSNNEIVQLTATVTSLRDQLEAVRIEK